MKFKDLPINKEISRFRNHIEELDNTRIIFSGIFGIGKTYFIQKFFESETNYIPIKLSPVNYSVNQNEDIFELIKYDIAFQVLSKNPDFEKTNFSNFFSGQFYILDNYKKIISNLIENLSKIDHHINSIVEPAYKLGRQIEEFNKDANKDDKKELTEFLTFFKDQKGTIKEENNITLLLSALISTLKKENKKVVLVIDDLDRIDPEHIFRLLNIFSAHFDFQELEEEENKFGFDKVILICDIENIRGIFHNKYGANIDFSGYIDKFYTHEIYYYNMENVIKEYLSHFLTSIKSSDQTFLQSLQSSGSYIKNDLQLFLSYLIDSNSVSLRKLFSFLNLAVTFPTYKLQVGKSSRYPIYSTSTPVFFILETLEKFFGNKVNFLKAIDKVIDKYPLISLERYGNYNETSIGSLAMIAGYSKTHLTPSSNLTYSYDILGYTLEYRIEVHNDSYGLTGYLIKLSSAKSNEEPTEYTSNYVLPYFQLLKEAYVAKNEIAKKFE